MSAEQRGTVATYLTWYHGQIVAALGKVATHVRKGELSDAREACHAFERELSKHFGAEEEIIFPAFERAQGTAPEPIASLREEHRLLDPLVRRLTTDLESGDPVRIRACLDELGPMLTAHSEREEALLYPMADDTLTTAERVALVSSQRRP